MRVVYISPFPPENISGGIKKPYQHVEILREHGIIAEVWQPFGKPDFIESKIKPLIDSFRPRAEDLLFFSPKVSFHGYGRCSPGPCRDKRFSFAQTNCTH
jgi:hypothetical protein